MDTLPVIYEPPGPLVPPAPPLQVVAQRSIFRDSSSRTIREIAPGPTLLELAIETGMAELRDDAVHLIGKVVIAVDGNLIERDYWHLVRPRPGRLVNIWVQPSGQREAILIGASLAIGALAIAAPPTLGITSPLLGSLVGAGIAVGGNYDLSRLEL
jgi:hypothetical protein